MNIDKDLVAAMATPLVLAILVEGSSYGYAILKRVREPLRGRGSAWTDGMLYPLLPARTARVHPQPMGNLRQRPAPALHEITPAGREQLAEQRRQWATANRTLGGLWNLAGRRHERRDGVPDRRMAHRRPARSRRDRAGCRRGSRSTCASRSPTSEP
ncbi:MAG: PadR family transcriptional regulator [Schumannella sp.]